MQNNYNNKLVVPYCFVSVIWQSCFLFLTVGNDDRTFSGTLWGSDVSHLDLGESVTLFSFSLVQNTQCLFLSSTRAVTEMLMWHIGLLIMWKTALRFHMCLILLESDCLKYCDLEVKQSNYDTIQRNNAIKTCFSVFTA